MPVLEAQNLVKRYGALVAVDGVDVSVPKGECFGFLGPNGAGKTTLMRMVYGFTPPAAGALQVLGLDVTAHPRRVKARLGVVPQENNLDGELTVRRNLLMYARFFGLAPREAARRGDALLDFMELAGKRDAMVDTLSGGMKRRLIIARALVNEPELLILDEPTTGLDPQARGLVWRKLRELKAGGTTILLTTHYMEEAEALCDRLVIMHLGKVIASGAPAELVGREVGREVVEVKLDPGEHKRVLETVAGIDGHEALDDRLFLHTEDGESLLERIHAAGFAIEEGRFRSASLEDVFLKLAGRRLND